MPWYDLWGWGLWFIVPLLMCLVMLPMMLLMGSGRMAGGRIGGCGGRHTGAAHTDPALETLRQRLASGELTPQEYEVQRKLLLTA